MIYKSPFAANLLRRGFIVFAGYFFRNPNFYAERNISRFRLFK